MEQRILSKIFAIMQRKEDKLINKRKIISFVTYLIKEGIIIKAAIFSSLSKRHIPQWRHLMLLSGLPMCRWGRCGEGGRAFHLATTAVTWMTELAQPTSVWQSTWQTTPPTLVSATSSSAARVVVTRFQTTGGLFGNGRVVITGTLVALQKVKSLHSNHCPPNIWDASTANTQWLYVISSTNIYIYWIPSEMLQNLHFFLSTKFHAFYNIIYFVHKKFKFHIKNALKL